MSTPFRPSSKADPKLDSFVALICCPPQGLLADFVHSKKRPSILDRDMRGSLRVLEAVAGSHPWSYLTSPSTSPYKNHPHRKFDT